MEGQYETNTGFACCRDFAAFGSLIGSIGLGLPRHRSRLRRLGAELLSHRCQAHRAASMRELQPAADLHHPVVSSRRLTRATVSFAPSFTLRHSSPRSASNGVAGISQSEKDRAPEANHSPQLRQDEPSLRTCGVRASPSTNRPKKRDFFVPPVPQWAL